MRVLLVEDDVPLATALAHGLTRRGMQVHEANTGALADSMLQVRHVDVLVLDLGLPDLSGMDVLARLRQRGSTLPVLILTARDAIQDRVTGLNAGADDYLLKPFDFDELEARLRALVRRNQADQSGWTQFGGLRLDAISRQIFYEQQALELSERETGVLELLLQRAGRVVSKDALLDHLGMGAVDLGDNAVEVYIHRVRKKLDATGVCIRTVRGLGYLLDRLDGG